jgi:hypothetical protein
MKVAVLSDIHDHLPNLNQSLQLVKDNHCEAIIFCGDYCSPTTFKALAGFGLPLYAIFGNVDGAKYEIMKAIMENKYQVEQKNDLLEVELDGKKIAACHKPEFAEGLAAIGKYDVVFYGHTHERRQKMVGKAILINPGEIMGNIEIPSFAIYDTEENKINFVEVRRNG